MKYYLIDGQYKSWDYLHNSLGYTTSATESVSYNSVINWGSGAGNGYCTDTDDVEAEYFVSGVVGWYNINQLALTVHLYPSDVEDFMAEKNGVVSNAVRMILDGTEYWLIEEEVKGENPYGWMTRSVAEQEGWHEYEDVTYEFIFVDSTTGRITYGVENLTEIEFTPTGYFTIDEGNEVVFVEQSPFPVVCIDEGTRTPESIAPDASFDTELPYYASKLYIVTTDDGQDETLYGWEAEEGTPAVALPTVTINDDFGGSNWLYLTLSENVQMNAGSVLAPTETYSYDSTKAYAVVFWQNVYGTNTGSADVGVVDDSGTLKLKNVSTSQIYIKCARVAVCSDSTVGKTIVYDANGDNHNAFVFDMSGTPYYYVLDGVQTDWTDDLSSIGYTKTAPVSIAGDYGSSNLLTATTSGNSRTLSAGSTGAPYISGTTGSGTYKYSRSYATYYGYETNGGNKIDPTRLGWLKGSGVSTLYWENISASSLTISWAVVALCSNPCADVVPVYNASNVAYNAFHYTENGTDYYYVLDGTQTDWTDDLTGIGYSLTQTLEIILALRYDPSTSQWKTVAFDQTPSATENYWWGCVIDQAGVAALQAIGLTYHDPSSIWGGMQFTGPIGNVVYNSGYSYEVIALYSDMGTTEVAQSLLPSLTLEPLNRDNTDLLTIWSKNVLDATPVKTWKVRITKL